MSANKAPCSAHMLAAGSTFTLTIVLAICGAGFGLSDRVGRSALALLAMVGLAIIGARTGAIMGDKIATRPR